MSGDNFNEYCEALLGPVDIQGPSPEFWDRANNEK